MLFFLCLRLWNAASWCAVGLSAERKQRENLGIGSWGHICLCSFPIFGLSVLPLVVFFVRIAHCRTKTTTSLKLKNSAVATDRYCCALWKKKKGNALVPLCLTNRNELGRSKDAYASHDPLNMAVAVFATEISLFSLIGRSGRLPRWRPKPFVLPVRWELWSSGLAEKWFLQWPWLQSASSLSFQFLICTLDWLTML